MKATRDLIRFALSVRWSRDLRYAQQSSTPPYRLSAASNGAVTVERGGKRAVYQPVFTIIRSETDPKLGLSGFASTPGESLEGVNVENYPLPRWRRCQRQRHDRCRLRGRFGHRSSRDRAAARLPMAAWPGPSHPIRTSRSKPRSVRLRVNRHASRGSSPRARRAGTRSATPAGRRAIRPPPTASCSR